MSVFVGLDCGGSSSRVLAIDDTGRIVHAGSSGAANLVSTPESRLKRNLLRATEGCPQAAAVCGCFAGLVSEELRGYAVRILHELFPTAQISAEPDYAAAFFACESDTQVCVIAGTGSLVCSFNGQRMVKSGGRGYLLGDDGSGYQFGREALVQFLNDPNNASTHLRSIVNETFRTEEESEIIPQVYRSTPPSTLIAKLAKGLARDATDGLPYALKSIREHTGALAEVTARHINQHVSTERIVVSLAGGIWKASPVFVATFRQILDDALPHRDIVVQKITKPPLHGAVTLAQTRFQNN